MVLSAAPSGAGRLTNNEDRSRADVVTNASPSVVLSVAILGHQEGIDARR